jgi:hypothetical protein
VRGQHAGTLRKMAGIRYSPSEFLYGSVTARRRELKFLVVGWLLATISWTWGLVLEGRPPSASARLGSELLPTSPGAGRVANEELDMRRLIDSLENDTLGESAALDEVVAGGDGLALCALGHQMIAEGDACSEQQWKRRVACYRIAGVALGRCAPESPEKLEYGADALSAAADICWRNGSDALALRLVESAELLYEQILALAEDSGGQLARNASLKLKVIRADRARRTARPVSP